jgi:hypothetical protein
MEKHFLVPMEEMGVKTQICICSLILSELGEYTPSSPSLATLVIRQWIWVAKMGVKTWRCHLSLLKTQGKKVSFRSSFARHDFYFFFCLSAHSRNLAAC